MERFSGKPRLNGFEGLRLQWVLCSALCCHLLVGQTRSDEFCLLPDDRSALQARVDLIQQAECEICVAYYAIDTGDVPIGLLSLLRQAAQRGVRVRILVDGLKSRLPSDLEKLLGRDGVEFRVYHPPYKGHPKWLNRRLHDKLFVVDRTAMVIGSRNLQDTHFGLEDVNYIDCDTYLSGDVCVEAAQYFDWLWETPDVRSAAETNSFGIDFFDNRKLKIPLGLGLTPKRVQAYEQVLQQSLERMVCKTGIQLGYSADLLPQCVANVQASLIHDARTDKSCRQIQLQIVSMMDSANCSILIASPYPVFSPEIQQALQRARERGVHVRLLTNSLKSTDRVIAYAAYQTEKSRFLKMGVELFEYPGKDHHHFKAMIVDERIVVLGSYNFDERSDHLNLELCVKLEEPLIAQLVSQSCLARLQQSAPIASRSLPPEIKEDTSALRRTRMRISQLTAPIYRRSL